jgi:hypothetical protein
MTGLAKPSFDPVELVSGRGVEDDVDVQGG